MHSFFGHDFGLVELQSGGAGRVGSPLYEDQGHGHVNPHVSSTGNLSQVHR